MAWTELQNSDAIGIGGDEGQRKTAGGLLVKIEYDQGKKKNSAVYELIQSDASSLRVWGSAAIDRKLSVATVGKFIRLKFVGIEQTSDGTDFKQIRVEVYDGELTDKMKEWPRVEEFYTATEGVEPMDGEEDDSDLPF